MDMDWIVSKTKQEYLGNRSQQRVDTKRDNRPQLVGLLTEDPTVVLPEGAHIVAEVLEAPPMDTIGHVTSSYMSPNTGRSIALALLQGGISRKGQQVTVSLMNGDAHNAEVTDTVFVDKEGVRVRG